MHSLAHIAGAGLTLGPDHITKAIDYFDLTKNGTLSLAEAFKGTSSKFLVISISSDWLYPPYQCKEIAEALSANDIDVRHTESAGW